MFAGTASTSAYVARRGFSAGRPMPAAWPGQRASRKPRGAVDGGQERTCREEDRDHRAAPRSARLDAVAPARASWLQTATCMSRRSDRPRIESEQAPHRAARSAEEARERGRDRPRANHELRGFMLRADMIFRTVVQRDLVVHQRASRASSGDLRWLQGQAHGVHGSRFTWRDPIPSTPDARKPSIHRPRMAPPFVRGSREPALTSRSARRPAYGRPGTRCGRRSWPPASPSRRPGPRRPR